MRIKRSISPVVFLFAACISLPLFGCRECPVTKEEHEKVVAKLREVEQELEEVKNGPDRLIRRAQAAFEAERFEEVIEVSGELVRKHPGTDEAKEAGHLQRQAEARLAIIEAERKREEEREARERERQIAEEKRKEERRIAEATRSMRKKEDKVRGITFYSDRGSPEYLNSRSDLHLYFGAIGGRPSALRLRIQYVAEDWLFIERYIVSADDVSYPIPVNYGEVERDNGSGEIWEWYDQVVTREQLEMVKAIINSRNAVIRYEGRQYYKDRTISAAEKKRLENVLIAFEALGGTI